jgi:hypothetical protein
MDKKIEVISSKFNNYIIKKNPIHGYYAIVRKRNIFKLMKELVNDFYGNSSIHPQFLDNRYYKDINSVRWLISVYIKMDNKTKK